MMRTLKISTVVALTFAALTIGGAKAQQPTPPMIVVQPAAPVAAAKPAPAAAGLSDTALTSAIKELEQVKATNDETLKKQEAMMQQLDELQKAAEQLKIFSKRV
jgi:hypothetical protein